MMKKLQVFLIFAISLIVSPKTILRHEENLFRKANVQIQNAVNKLLTLMQLKNNFMMLENNRLLLSMHASLKTIAERNYEIYTDIQKLCYINAKRKLKDGLFNLDKLIKVLIENKLVPNHLPINGTKPSKRFGGENYQGTFLEIPGKSEDTILFLRDYLNMEGIELAGFESPFQKIRNAFQQNKASIGKRRNLKLWRFQNTTEEDNHYPNTRRVFQGKRVKINNYPFMASIHVMGEFVCSGSIISKNMIITAATCLHLVYKSSIFIHENPQGVVIRVGSDYTQRFGEVCLVQTIFFHPHFNPDSLANNLAVIKIVKRLQFKKKNKKIRRIEYRRMEAKLTESVKDIVLLGWGDRDEDSISIYEPLANAHLDVYNFEQCQQTYSKKFVTEKNFCAGFMSKGGGACSRDVGGPALLSSVLVGVVSYGPPVCGTPDAPTVFTNIGYYRQWIDSIIEEVPYIPNELTTMHKPLFMKTSLKKLPVTTVATQMTHTEHFRSKFLKQRALLSNDSSNGYRKPRSEYPKAVQVLTSLLEQIFTEAARDGVDDFMDDDSDSNNEGFGTVVTKNADESPTVKTLRDSPNGLRSDDNVSPSTFVSVWSNINSSPASASTAVTDGIYEQNFDSIKTHFTQNESEETLEIVTGSDSYVNKPTEDPFSVAINALKTYLDINKHTVTESSTATNKDDIKPYMVTKGMEEEIIFESEESESDNYESEGAGLSIEIPPGLSYVPTRSGYRVTSPKHNDDGDEEPINNTFGYRNSLEDSEETNQEIAEQVLNQNFVKSQDPPDVKNDEFVVFVSKQKSTKRPKGEFRKQEEDKPLGENPMKNSLSNFIGKPKNFESVEDEIDRTYELIKDTEGARRHFLEEYIITS